ncbi:MULTISPECIES: AAA family ATPase [Helicobacter]|uniref:AAA family ATPase n=1 Tax=Helicobacter TaxID=209 RepID=UPI0026109BB8|nr:AAA family ATPase [Helicobacter sp. UBA3407]
MEKERLIIKNFGPIVEADIEIKPFMVFIGESGSGKSVILKLLSLLRWIAKKNRLNILAKRLGAKGLYRFRIDRIIKESGLNDFLSNTTFVQYFTDFEEIVIDINEKKLSLNIKSYREEEVIFEKISFITDDRFAIAMLLNNQIRGVMPYHLQKTYEDFEESFQALSDSKKAKIDTMGIELTKEKYGIQEKFFIKKGDSKTQLHNSSSGMKSVTIIELISYYFAYRFSWRAKLKQILFDIFLSIDFANMERASQTIYEKDVIFRVYFFIEEPELSLFPNMQKKLVEHLSKIFNQKKNIHIAFSTHSPYILSALNCLLLAQEVVSKNQNLKEKVENIIPSRFWLDIKRFDAFKIKNGEVKSIIDKETKLILADEIDEVSEEIGEMFDSLLDLEYK